MTLRTLILAGVIFASSALHAARAAEPSLPGVGTMVAWDISEQKKPAPEKPPRPRPSPGPREGGEDE